MRMEGVIAGYLRCLGAWSSLCVTQPVSHAPLHAHDENRPATSTGPSCGNSRGRDSASGRRHLRAGASRRRGARNQGYQSLRPPRRLDAVRRDAHHGRSDLRVSRSPLAGEARDGDRFVDLIFAGGDGFVEVDDEWLAHGVPSIVLDISVRLVAAEGMVCSKAFVMERERFDGADVAHVLRKSGAQMDWPSCCSASAETRRAALARADVSVCVSRSSRCHPR